MATGNGNLIALDATAGRALWHFHASDSIASAPISYALDGKQYIAISTGNTLYSFALPDQMCGPWRTNSRSVRCGAPQCSTDCDAFKTARS
jgi:outer membrane protein assembly factor BamB